MPRGRDGALIRLQMATGWEGEQAPPAKLCGDSVESMRRIFISPPDSSEEDGPGGREERPEGPAVTGSPGAPPCPRNSGEARAVSGASPPSPPPKKAPHREHRRDAQRCLHYIVPCMNAYGMCIVDHFLGHRLAEKILQEVLALHLSDKFQDGALASQKPGSSKTIRGDKILWVEGSEPGCENIGYLLKRMDKLVMFADGKLGHYRIRGRHKVSSFSGGARLSAKFSGFSKGFHHFVVQILFTKLCLHFPGIPVALLFSSFYSLPPACSRFFTFLVLF